MSFLVAGRNKDAPRFSRGILIDLQTAAESLGLTSEEKWRSAFAVGYIFRHARLGLEKAKSEHWSGWMQSAYPDDNLVKANFLETAPGTFNLDRCWLETHYDDWVSTLRDPESDFAQGAVWADRVWHSCKRDIQLNDPVGLAVKTLEKRYHRLFGSRLGNLVGFRMPGHYYRFLIAQTLAPKAFDKTFSDVELAKVLNKKTT